MKAGGKFAPVAASVVLLVGMGCTSHRAIDSAYSADHPVLWEPATGDPAGKVTFVAQVQTAHAGRLAVLSYNMQHRDRPRELAAFAETLREVEGLPDFILCQEVLFGLHKTRDSDNTAAILADELGYHAMGTDRRGSREGVAIVSRYPFTFYDERHLKARTSPLLFGFARVSVMGEFIVAGIGRVRVVTTHLAYQPWEGHVRRKQLDETLAWLAEREAREPAAVTIFGGDFNLRPGAPEFAPLFDPRVTGRLRFLDANTLMPTLGWPGHPFKRVDYIFVSAPYDNVRFDGERLLFAEGVWYNDGSRRFHPSDHLPVLHGYTLTPTALAAAPGGTVE